MDEQIKLLISGKKKRDLNKFCELMNHFHIQTQTEEQEDSLDVLLTLMYNMQDLEEVKKRGAGAKKKKHDGFFEEDAVAMMKDGYTAQEVAALFGMSRATLFRRLKEAEEWGEIRERNIKVGRKPQSVLDRKKK